ncbi:hypothetical protein [Streptomyces xanthochromogenes]|uniref:hypothetical protein n=1 Tax=Streptomyces xanthochromogenes TaxID=67384 RepID=UPI00341DBEF9
MTCESRHEVRGIVLSRRQAGLDERIGVLAQSLADAAVANACPREAIERFLVRPSRTHLSR